MSIEREAEKYIEKIKATVEDLTGVKANTTMVDTMKHAFIAGWIAALENLEQKD